LSGTAWYVGDLQQRIKQAFDVQLHERSVGKLLRKLAFRGLSVRPQPGREPVECAQKACRIAA
jgi:hypothetical protein